MLSRADVPDALFPSDNAFGIPLLDLALQADYPHLPVMTWGAVKRNQTMLGTWHFYTDDYRYEALWSDPSPVVNSRCVAVVEPNFTTSEQMAKAVALYQIYRKRWLARYWQSQGLRIFVDLNVAPDWYHDNMLGVPRGWRAYMTRGYADRVGYLAYEHFLATCQALTDDILFCVYGGGDAVRQWCLEHASVGAIYIAETCDVRKGKGLDG